MSNQTMPCFYILFMMGACGCAAGECGEEFPGEVSVVVCEALLLAGVAYPDA